VGGAGLLTTGAGGAGYRGRLLVCATPIGNLEDVTLRVLDALREADVVACEDTRQTRKLLDRHGIRAAELLSYHAHNEGSRAAPLARRALHGETVAVVSDAGMPGVSDPGLAVVRACVALDVPVSVLPGPSSVVAAVVASGLPVDTWRFAGFLPRKAGELATFWKGATEALVAFESPKRVGASLAALAAVDPVRPVAVCRELTKVHEEVVRGSAAALAERYAAEAVRGEVVVVVGPPGGDEAPGAGDAAFADALAAMRRLVESGARTRVAAGVVAELTDASANALYDAHIATKE
jgi:16S rRNA (cytidine1402-2'-O)-methyltransferase